MVTLGQDPNAVFGRFNDRQQREQQFTQDIQKVIFGGSSGDLAAGRTRGSAAASRTRSPGLAAGASLMLGGCGTAAAAEAHAEARSACRQAAENARKGCGGCPFDDHRAFGSTAGDLGRQARQLPPPAPDDSRMAHQAAKSLGRQNRDLQQKIGAGAPFDAPFESSAVQAAAASTASSPAGGLVPPGVSAPTAPSFAEVQSEAARYKSRMRGTQDLISGGYLQSDSSAAKRNQSLPPRPKDALLPEANMRLQYHGGSLSELTHEKTAYLNSKVLSEGNRARNEFRSIHLA